MQQSDCNMRYFREGTSNSTEETKVRFRILFCFFLGFIFVTANSQRLSAQFANCADCDAAFTLSRTDLQCLAKRIDRLLARPDPVYFDAANCDQGSVPVMSSSLPTITRPAPTATPANKWLQLTKQQLLCLRAKLPELEASTDNPIKVSLKSTDCPGNKP